MTILRYVAIYLGLFIGLGYCILSWMVAKKHNLCGLYLGVLTLRSIVLLAAILLLTLDIAQK